MQAPLMSFGLFVFGLDTLAFEELRRSAQYRHAEQAVVGARPPLQFLGPGPEDVTLNGRLFPGFAGTADSLAQLRAMAEEGRAWPLITGYGAMLGAYVVEGLDEGQSHFTPDGAARRIEFTLKLKRVDAVVIDAAQLGSTTVGEFALLSDL